MTYRAIASRCANTLLAVASLPPSPPSALMWIKGMNSGRGQKPGFAVFSDAAGLM
jgi:hypothetical protein